MLHLLDIIPFSVNLTDNKSFSLRNSSRNNDTAVFLSPLQVNMNGILVSTSQRSTNIPNPTT